MKKTKGYPVIGSCKLKDRQRKKDKRKNNNPQVNDTYDTIHRSMIPMTQSTGQ
jgi:hypothetical protein